MQPNTACSSARCEVSSAVTTSGTRLEGSRDWETWHLSLSTKLASGASAVLVSLLGAESLIPFLDKSQYTTFVYPLSPLMDTWIFISYFWAVMIKPAMSIPGPGFVCFYSSGLPPFLILDLLSHMSMSHTSSCLL